MTMMDVLARGVKNAIFEKPIRTMDLEGTIDRFSHWDNDPTPKVMFVIEGDRRTFHLKTAKSESINGSTDDREKWAIILTKPGDRVRFSVVTEPGDGGAGTSEVKAFTNLTMTGR